MHSGGPIVNRWLARLACLFSLTLHAQSLPAAPPVLPAAAVAQLSRSLDAAKPHARHLWRDTPPLNADGTVNGYVEIPRDDRRKWELDMAANARAIDRMMPETLGGYPVNYGFVPQTLSYDGDPFDILVLGPPLTGGELVRGVIVGVMRMEDEKGLDSKVVISIQGRDGRPLHALTSGDQQRIGEYFRKYKEHEPGKFSKVSGWGTVEEGLSFVKTTHAFFLKCRNSAGQACRITP
jgi:inorganic pyrophosphatase